MVTSAKNPLYLSSFCFGLSLDSRSWIGLKMEPGPLNHSAELWGLTQVDRETDTYQPNNTSTPHWPSKSSRRGTSLSHQQYKILVLASFVERKPGHMFIRMCEAARMLTSCDCPRCVQMIILRAWRARVSKWPLPWSSFIHGHATLNTPPLIGPACPADVDNGENSCPRRSQYVITPRTEVRCSRAKQDRYSPTAHLCRRENSERRECDHCRP